MISPHNKSKNYALKSRSEKLMCHSIKRYIRAKKAQNRGKNCRKKPNFLGELRVRRSVQFVHAERAIHAGFRLLRLVLLLESIKIEVLAKLRSTFYHFEPP
jgi:hypothetical protein